MIPNRWENQEDALKFALSHNSCMLDMDMGTGKTRVAIDAAFSRKDAYRVLVVCPKAVVPVWRTNLEKFANPGWVCWDTQVGSVAKKAESVDKFLHNTPANKQFVVMNYDVVWRHPMGDLLLKSGFNMVILDESHRAKSAGSKVSKYLAMLGKRVKYKMCLSGTPMANSPLDVYGQYRFLDQSIFGTNHNAFLQEYAIMGGPERRFVVGYKNQNALRNKFQSIAYTCKMSDVSDRIKLPSALPPIRREVAIPTKDMKVSNKLAEEFISECEGGHVVVSNVLVKMLRLQQIAAGFCQVQANPIEQPHVEEMNTSKEDSLHDLLQDISIGEPVVVFCVFKHDLEVVGRVATRNGRNGYELSGQRNELDEWRNDPTGGVLAVQIQSGAEGVDMTKAHYAVYFSLPHSLALYDQSKARLYRPGQVMPVTFIHLIATGTIDESMYESLERKKDIVESVKDGSFNFGFVK